MESTLEQWTSYLYETEEQRKVLWKNTSLQIKVCWFNTWANIYSIFQKYVKLWYGWRLCTGTRIGLLQFYNYFILYQMTSI